MKRWTPEAEQRLDNYLEEIVNLARSSGEADEDFVEELRQHIRSDAEESAGGVVTPQNLERALAAAGKPRDVLGMETESPGNGNGHGSPRADEASEGNVSRPYVVPSAKPLLKVRLILGGIVLPSLAICMEFFLLTVSGGGGVGVMPTLMHVLMIALVPLSVWYLIARSDPGADMASERDRSRIAAVLGYLTSIGLIYTVFLAPITPFALIGILYLGVGLIGLSPAIALLCSLYLHYKFVKLGLFAGSDRRRAQVWFAAGVLIAALPLAGHWGLQTSRHHNSSQVLHGDTDAREHALGVLRVIGTPDPSTAWGRDESLSYIWRRLLTGDRRWDDGWLSVEDLEKVHFRATGRLPDSGAVGSRWYTTNAFSQRWNSLREQGGDKVGAMIPGLSLSSSNLDVDMVRDGLAESGLSYTEWVLEFANDNPDVNEARCVIAMPPGSVASRLTLWINGVECEAAFGGVGQVKAAYQDVAIVRRQDPALLSNPAKGEVFLQCFPVPAFGKMKVKIGVTAPLQSLGGKSFLMLPRIADENFTVAPRFFHQISAESQRALSSPISGLTAIPGNGGNHSIVGRALHKAISGKDGAPWLLVEGAVPMGTFQGQLGPYMASMDIIPAQSEASRSVWLVVDGSAGVGRAEIDWAGLVGAFPEDAALHATFAGFTPEHWDESGGRDGLIAWLASRDFGYGQRVVPAMVEASQRALATANGELLVIHGPQPYDDEEDDALASAIKRGRRNGGALPVRMVGVAPGPNAVARALVNFSEVEAIATFDSVQKTLEQIARAGVATDLVRSYTLSGDGASPEDVAPHGTASHVVRMAALDRIMGLLRSESPLETEEAVAIAKRCRLVTPVSGAVVLENQAQYARHGLDDGESLDAVPAVPEPEEWLLVGVAALALGIAWVRRNKARAGMAH